MLTVASECDLQPRRASIGAHLYAAMIAADRRPYRESSAQGDSPEIRIVSCFFFSFFLVFFYYFPQLESRPPSAATSTATFDGAPPPPQKKNPTNKRTFFSKSVQFNRLKKKKLRIRKKTGRPAVNKKKQFVFGVNLGCDNRFPSATRKRS